MTTAQGSPRHRVTITEPKLSGSDRVMNIGFPATHRTPSWLQLSIPIDKESDTCEMSRRIAVQLATHKIWEHPPLERLFWNFERFCTDPSYISNVNKIPSEREYVTRKVSEITKAVRLANTAGRNERTPLEFARSVFGHNATAMIETMSRAVANNDTNTILQLGPECSLILKSADEGKKSVHLWMRRACVRAVLGIQSFDNLVMEAANDANKWIHKLQDAANAYEAHLNTTLRRALNQLPDLTREIHIPDGTTLPVTGTWTHGAVKSPVVIKALRYSDDTEYTISVKNLRESLALWNASRHKSVQHMLGICYTGPQRMPALVSLWRKRGNIVHYIKSRHTQDDPAKFLQRILNIMGQLLETLEHFHEKSPPVAHGNLKGSNILLDDDGFIRLCDFGLARTARTHKSPGFASWEAVQFISPERLQKKSGPSLADDMWAVSCIFVQLATTHLPYDHVWNRTHHTPTLVAAICNSQQGLRPARPSNVPSNIWGIFCMNWETDPEARLTARQTLAKLNAVGAASGGRSPMRRAA